MRKLRLKKDTLTSLDDAQLAAAGGAADGTVTLQMTVCHPTLRTQCATFDDLRCLLPAINSNIPTVCHCP